MTKKLKAHPVADLFPMLPDDELNDLAHDIAERGLLQAIVLDVDGLILDGRNRYMACELASVEPTFTTYDGDDPDGFALAVNLSRRHLTTGARAVIAAKARRLNGQRGNKFVTDDEKLNKQRLHEAGLVLDWCDTATINKVIAGDMPLSKAVEEARALKKADAEREAKKARLREHASDLLVHVEEADLDLDDAIAALNERERVAKEKAERDEAEAEELRAERQARNEEHFGSLGDAIHTLALNTAGMDEYDDTPHDKRTEDAFLTDRLQQARNALDNIIDWSKARD